MSAPDISCYQDIIGLYQGDCDCYGTPPSDYNVSNSGLFIADLFEPKMINGLLNCDQGDSIWELMEIVRELAIRRFIADSNALLMKHHSLTRQPFYGAIGRATFKNTKTLINGYYAGVRMYIADVVSGYMTITKIGTIFDFTGTITLFGYNNLNKLIDTVSLNTISNIHTLNDVNIELQLHNRYVDNLEYYFIYQAETGKNPKDNDVKCFCGSFKPVFNINKPYYMTASNRQYGWADYLMAGGFYRSDISDLMNLVTTTSNYMYGLTFDVNLGCKVGEVYCKDQLDFDRNTLAQAMALAIQHKAAELFIDKLFISTNLNRDILINKEELDKKKVEYQDTYNEMTNYIASNIDVSTNDCFECKDIVGMIKAGIMK